MIPDTIFHDFGSHGNNFLVFVALETGSKTDDFIVVLGSSQILGPEWVEGQLVSFLGTVNHSTGPET